MRFLPSTFGLAVLIAGCSGSPVATDAADTPLTPGADPATGLVDYTTLHVGGEPFVRTYDGRLTPDEAAQSNSLPFGASAPMFESCCSMDWVDVTDLLQTDQLVALRLTLTWTNTASDRAGLDVAACLPWACQAFNFGADESQQEGPHTDVLDLITSGRAEFAEMGMPYQVGVRYTNAILSSGMPYAITAEAFPVENGLAIFDPYTVEVADNATLAAELVGPFAADGVTLALMVYDRSDRPIQWIPLSGAHGSRHNFTLPAGDYVVIPMDVQGGFVRLSTDAAPDSLAMERLAEEFSQVEVATVADPQQHGGTYTYDAPPGTIDPFPVFIYDEGAAAQDPFGLSPTPLGGALATLRSSSGDIAVVDQRQFYAQAAGQQSCLQCSFDVPTFNPQNYIDDDGRYELVWSSDGGTGSFVLFTAKYLR